MTKEDIANKTFSLKVYVLTFFVYKRNFVPKDAAYSTGGSHFF